MSFLAIEDKIKRHIYKCFYKFTYKKYYKKILKLNICTIGQTIHELINTNKSIGRFGDGELRWLLDDNHDSFEKSSKILSDKLYHVLVSNNSQFMIALPDAFNGLNNFTKNAENFWKLFFAEYGNDILPYLNKDKLYYNTSISRVYMDYKNKSNSKYYFKLLKNIWDNKKILIIEGSQSRLGVDDGLFNNALIIRRIECPITNAFESYKEILITAVNFLKYHGDYITILSLGPTATVMSYNLFKLGFRSIDLGHIDIEYDWYLMGAKKKENIKNKYVNEMHSENKTIPIHNNKYNHQILKKIN